MLGVSRLLAMAKDIGSLRPIVVGEVFFRLINCSIVLQLWEPFQEHLSPHCLEYQPLEAVRPFFLASNPSSTCTLIGSRCRLDLENVFNSVYRAIIFKELCDAGGFLASIVLFTMLFYDATFLKKIPTWATCGGGHHY